MTAREFQERTSARVAVLSALEYRARRAAQLGLRLKGLVLTEAEADAITTLKGQRVWVEGRLLPVRKVIPFRIRID